MSRIIKIYRGDSRAVLPQRNIKADLIMTSPPYADARKGHYTAISPDQFPEWFATFHQCLWDCLKPDGSFVINIKDKIVDGVRDRYVWKTVDVLTSLGWKCIDDYIWAKTNPMPGRWPSRLGDGWEYCFHLAKHTRPYFNSNAVRRAAKNETLIDASRRLQRSNNTRIESATGSGKSLKRLQLLARDTALPSNVITCAVECRNQNHPAVYPVALPDFFIKLLSPAGGVIVDPFMGSGTTGITAINNNRSFYGIEKEEKYYHVARARLFAAVR